MPGNVSLLFGFVLHRTRLYNKCFSQLRSCSTFNTTAGILKRELHFKLHQGRNEVKEMCVVSFNKPLLQCAGQGTSKDIFITSTT